jgi:ribonucleoside-triphosphate reductase
LGYLYRADEKGLFERLDQLLSIAKRSLEVKRKMIQGFMDQGLFPYTKRYLGTLKNHFSTIGVNGINEMIRNFTGDRDDISTEFGQTFALKFLTHIREQMKTFQEETGNLYNLEATPAEGTTYRFAKEDQRRYDGIIQSGTEERPYYTNSSQLPVGFTDDPFEALDKQEKLQSQYTGGTVLHLYMSERISTVEACKKLVRRSLENYRLPYLTVTPTFSICPDHGYLNGEQPICPECGSKTEVWTRVMGYHRPVSEFNAGKVSEYEDRILFKEQRAVEQLEIREQTGSLRAIANTK